MKENRKLLKEVLKDIRHDMTDEEVLNLLGGQIANEDMVEMTYQVDVMGRSVDEVARAFLVSLGLLQG